MDQEAAGAIHTYPPISLQHPLISNQLMLQLGMGQEAEALVLLPDAPDT